MMKSRRLIASPMAQGKTSYQVKLAQRKGTPDAPDVRKGSKGDLTAPKSNFRSTPKCGLNSDIAGGPFGANNGSSRSFDHRISACERCRQKIEVEGFCGFD